MVTLIVVSFIAGAILGVIVRVHALVLISAAALIAIVAVFLYGGGTNGEIVLNVVAPWISLQCGYFVGLIAQLVRVSRTRDKIMAPKENGAPLKRGED